VWQTHRAALIKFLSKAKGFGLIILPKSIIMVYIAVTGWIYTGGCIQSQQISSVPVLQSVQRRAEIE